MASLDVAVLAAAVVFGLWYPAPFAALAGGTTLFVLLTSVDVVLGPALTLVVASPRKQRSELRRDLAAIIALQLAAFAYGMYTITVARPVVVAFEIDRFRVVSAVDVEEAELDHAEPSLRRLSLKGPRMIAAVKPSDPAGQMRALDLGLSGIDLAMTPANWRPYEHHRVEAWRVAKPLPALIASRPEAHDAAAALARTAGQPIDTLRFLPVVSRQASWSAVLGPGDARILGYLPVDGFV